VLLRDIDTAGSGSHLCRQEADAGALGRGVRRPVPGRLVQLGCGRGGRRGGDALERGRGSREGCHLQELCLLVGLRPGAVRALPGAALW
jgi:hypothetical protein